jgi:ATP synthase protein I
MKSEDDDSDLEARLRKLSGALKAQRPAPAASPSQNGAQPSDSFGSAVSMGLRAGSEFVAAVLVGGAIGWGLDWVLHSKPAFTILFFMLGVVAGVWNVIRATSPKGASSDRNSPLSGAIAEDKDVPRVGPRGGDEDEG